MKGQAVAFVSFTPAGKRLMRKFDENGGKSFKQMRDCFLQEVSSVHVQAPKNAVQKKRLRKRLNEQ